jgi:hypothetical protein
MQDDCKFEASLAKLAIHCHKNKILMGKREKSQCIAHVVAVLAYQLQALGFNFYYRGKKSHER